MFAGADDFRMTTAPNTPVHTDAVADGTTLLPSRDALLDRLGEQLATPAAPAALVILGLLRRDDGWPTAQSTLALVTTLLAGSVRGDDWLGKSGPGEFAVVLAGPVTAAQNVAARLVSAVPTLGVPELTAAAGIAPLTPGTGAPEVLRRALASLTAARRAGAGTVIRYREPY